MTKGTELIKCSELSLLDIQRGAEIIKNGGLVAFPTETVYGLGADGLDEESIDRLYKAKGRPSTNPLILHISHVDMIGPLIDGDLGVGAELIERYWPGPLTLVYKKSDLVPDIVSGGLDTVSVRMPADPVGLKLIELVGRPLAGPSANLSGRPSPTNVTAVYEDLNGRIDMILDNGETVGGIESTVLSLVDVPTILRPGAVSIEELSQILPDVIYDPDLGKDDAISPGQRHKFSNDTTRYILTGSTENKLENMNRLRDLDTAVVVSQELAAEFVDIEDLWVYGSIDDLKTIGENLFKILREIEGQGYKKVIVEGVVTEGLGMAIMNRLYRGSNVKIVRD